KGTLRLGGREYPIILRPVRRNKPDFDLSAGTQSMIDLDQDGDFSLRWRTGPSGDIIAPEQVPLNAPFRIDDQAFQATYIDRHGTKLVIESAAVNAAPSIRFKAPAFEAGSFDDKTYSLQDFKGQTILMEFWSPDCRFSDKARAWVEYITDKYGDRVTVLSIMIPPDETAYQNYLKDHTMSSLAVKSNDDLRETYNPSVITPTFFVIDKTGTIRFKGSGISVIEVVDRLLESIL
ncbi:MAG: TlpA family protein disulfide reductase, partial [Candidatus Aminicenantaceae bacterium]